MKLFYILICFAIGIHANAQKIKVTEVNRLELKHILSSSNTIQLIDVRTPKEFTEGHIEKAINIPIHNRKQFKKQIKMLQKEAPIYMYCYSGIRSKKASKIIIKLGFLNVFDFSDGWQVWRKHLMDTPEK